MMNFIPFKIGETSTKARLPRELKVYYKDSVSSTNDWAKSALSPSCSLFLCDEQTKGRGRGNHTWSQGNVGSSLLSSWVFQLSSPAHPVTSCRVGLATWQALISVWPWLSFSLKAPNDIYLGEKKVGGILIENIQQDPDHFMIIGLGLNVFSHPTHIENASSLGDHLSSGFLSEGSSSKGDLNPQDWFSFIQRLFFEFSLVTKDLVVSTPLSRREQKSLLHALNLKPGLPEPYTQIREDGTLFTSQKTFHWSEL